MTLYETDGRPLLLPIKQPDSELSSSRHDEDDRQTIRSVESLTTLSTNFSCVTTTELENAIVELHRLFQEDGDLTPLPCQATKDTASGPEQLQCNLGLLLNAFGRKLQEEASEELQELTCRLVTNKAQYVAHRSVEELSNKPSFSPVNFRRA